MKEQQPTDKTAMEHIAGAAAAAAAEPQVGFLPQLKRHEGLRLKMYKCSAGKNTIGYGFNLDDNEIPLEIAELLLDHAIMKLFDEFEATDKMPIIEKLSGPRQAVLLNMGYNLGVQGVLGFRQMWAALAAGNYKGAASEMLNSKWAGQVGKRADELAMQMRTGLWDGEQ